MLNREPAWTSLLSTAHANHQMAIGFDAIYNELSDEERKELAQANLQNRNPSDAARLAITGNTFPCNQLHGAQLLGTCIAMTGIAAMAVSNEIPEAAEWINMVSRATNRLG